MNHPTLLALKGPPGSGKTTLARAISRQLRWPLIDKDDIRDLTDNEPPGLSYNVPAETASSSVRGSGHFPFTAEPSTSNCPDVSTPLKSSGFGCCPDR